MYALSHTVDEYYNVIIANSRDQQVSNEADAHSLPKEFGIRLYMWKANGLTVWVISLMTLVVGSNILPPIMLHLFL
jgi:hypothetical protein